MVYWPTKKSLFRKWFSMILIAAQPPWLLEHADFVSWAPTWMTEIGGTIPAFIASFALYIIGMQVWTAMRSERVGRASAPAGADGGS